MASNRIVNSTLNLESKSCLATDSANKFNGAGMIDLENLQRGFIYSVILGSPRAMRRMPGVCNPRDRW